MTKKQTSRISRLAPNGIPKWIRCYDSGADGGFIDRFTVVFTGRLRAKCCGEVPHLGMNEAPFWPQGFCQHMSYDCACDTLGKNGKQGCWPPAIGRKCHLGLRIPFSALNSDCRKAVWMDYADYWDIPNPMAKSPASVSVKG
jgi:hypothetical protein